MLGLNRETRRRRRVISRSQSDLRRWTEPQSFNDRWEHRSVFAAAYCAESRAVCDIGCGMQKLRRFLRPGTLYLPVDLKKWTDDTTVCNLNEGQFPTEAVSKSDTVTMLGVLEYIYDVPAILKKVGASRPRLIVSYNPSDLLERDRQANGWVNGFSLGDLAALLLDAGFVVCDVRIIEQGQVILKAVPE